MNSLATGVLLFGRYTNRIDIDARIALAVYLIVSIWKFTHPETREQKIARREASRAARQ